MAMSSTTFVTFLTFLQCDITFTAQSPLTLYSPLAVHSNIYVECTQCFAVTFPQWHACTPRFPSELNSVVYFQMFMTAYIIVSIISVCVLCAESMPQAWSVMNTNVNNSSNVSTHSPSQKIQAYIPKSLDDRLVMTECVTTSFSTTVLILRVLSRTDLKSFFLHSGQWLTFISLLANWVVLSSDYYDTGNLLGAPFFMQMFIVLRGLRTLGMLHIPRLMRGWDLILLTLKGNIWELGILCALFLTGTVIFSTGIYFAEYANPHSYPNIPSGFWWAIVTMTTVGYGDMYPTTPFGYTIGAVCAVVGIFAASLLIPIISADFIQMRNDWLMVYGNDIIRRRKTYEETIDIIAYLASTEQTTHRTSWCQ